MNKQETRLIQKLIKKTEKGEITWQLESSKGVSPSLDETGSERCPFVAYCGDLTLKLYRDNRSYRYRHTYYLEISDALVNTILEDSRDSLRYDPNLILDLFMFIYKSLEQVKEETRRAQEIATREQAKKNSLIVKLTQAL